MIVKNINQKDVMQKIVNEQNRINNEFNNIKKEIEQQKNNIDSVDEENLEEHLFFLNKILK